MKIKRIFALLLSLITVFSAFAVSASAADRKLNYVVLGDSIAYGSGIYNSGEACYGRTFSVNNIRGLYELVSMPITTVYCFIR